MSAPRKRVSPHVWVPTTYFAEGYPYTIVNGVAEVFFQQAGASLAVVGLTSLLHLPWNLKLFWAPLVDRIATKRAWLISMQALGALLIGLLAPTSLLDGSLPQAAFLFLLLAVVSATNDVAIDGYYMEVLDEAQQSKFVGYRAMAYKVSSLVVRGPLLGLCGLLGWTAGFSAMALLLAFLAGLHAWSLARDRPGELSFRDAVFRLRARPLRSLRWLGILSLVLVLGAALRGRFMGAIRSLPALDSISASGWIATALVILLFSVLAWLPRLRASTRAGGGAILLPLLHLLERPRMKLVLLFVVFFRTGESFLQKMKFPFLSEELGLTVSGYALASGTMGVLASFLGTFLGGALIARHGLERWVWPFLLAQNVLNLLYAGLAWVAPQLGGLGDATQVTTVSTVVIAVEEFGAGLGTAVFMVYLMRLCHPDHKAAHFAILTALMSLSFTVAGALSGFIAEQAGFAVYFGLTFLATVPMMSLVPFVVVGEVLDWGRETPETPR